MENFPQFNGNVRRTDLPGLTGNLRDSEEIERQNGDGQFFDNLNEDQYGDEIELSSGTEIKEYKSDTDNTNNVKGSEYKPGGRVRTERYTEYKDGYSRVKTSSFQNDKITITYEDGTEETYNVPEKMRKQVEGFSDWNSKEGQRALNAIIDANRSDVNLAASRQELDNKASRTAARLTDMTRDYSPTNRVTKEIEDRIRPILDSVYGIDPVDISDVKLTPADKQAISAIVTEDLNSLLEKYPSGTPENDAMRNEIYKLMIKGSEQLVKDTEKEISKNPSDKELKVKLDVYKQQLKTFNHLYDKSGLKPKQTEFEKFMERIGNVTSTVLDTLNAIHPSESLAKGVGLFNAVVTACNGNIEKKDVKEFQKAADDAKIKKYEDEKKIDDAKREALEAKRKLREEQNFDETTAAAERATKRLQAQISLINAQKEYTNALNGGSPQEQLESQTAYLNALKAYNDAISGGSELERLQNQTAVTDARTALIKAQERYENALNGGSELERLNAEKELLLAQKDILELQKGDSETKQIEDEIALLDAKARLVDAKTKLKDAENGGSREEQLTAQLNILRLEQEITNLENAATNASSD